MQSYRYALVRYTYERVVRVQVTDDLARIFQAQQTWYPDDLRPRAVLDADSAIEQIAHPASRLLPSHVPEDGLAAADYTISIQHS